MSTTRYQKLAVWTLAYTLAAIVWGAFVRASFSGDGCGKNWPDCGGVLIPLDGSSKALIEFSHRASSGLILPLVVLLVIGAMRLFSKGSPVRKAAWVALLFTLLEAGIGAALVKFGWVASDDSVARALMLAVHLVNTFVLIAAIALCAWFSKHDQPMRVKSQPGTAIGLAMTLVATLILGISGAFSALGGMLFPVNSLAEGLRQDLSPTAHYLERLRLLHPLIATSVSVFILLVGAYFSYSRPSPIVKKWFRIVAGLIAAQMLLGFINLVLHAPVALQLPHLLLADLFWLALIMATVATLQTETRAVEPSEQAVVQMPAERPVGRATLKDYITLTKPKVISLLLFTTLAAMFAAAQGWPGGWLLLAVGVGGYMAAGAANSINMVIERDLDLRMKRTSKRPTVTQKIPAVNAMLFGFGLMIGSFAILWSAANLLSALMALCGFSFYVVVYTLLLKRRTWHNIVIGGAAGSFPPLVGWAAVTNDLGVMAWILFGIVFLWTPVHFWALAILIKDDYAKAGVPMLPVVHGERVTILQIGLYAVLTAGLSVLPILVRQAGWLYLGAAVLLNLVLFARCFDLYRAPERPQVVSLYKYSMVYLALLFMVIAIDRAVSL